MSDKPSFTRDAALAVAMELRDKLEPLCVRIEIAGSIRRMKREAHDVELLYIPKHERQRDMADMFESRDANLVDDQLERWLKDGTLTKRLSKTGVPAWGKENKLAVHTPSGVPVDFFATDVTRWWVALVIRTGGKSTNLKLTTSAQRNGRRLEAYGAGVRIEDSGEVRPCTNEREVFIYCGVPYQEPWERE